MSSLIGLGLIACSGQSGSENANPNGEPPGNEGDLAAIADNCQIHESFDIGLDEQSRLGFAPRDMLNLLEQHSSSLLAFADQRDSELNFSLLSIQEPALFIEREPQEPGRNSSVACEDRVDITVQLGMSTNDGRLQETFTAVLSASQIHRSGFFAELDADQLTGSLNYEDFDSAQYDSRVLLIDALFESSDQASGTLTGRGQTSDAQQFIAIGSWPRTGD